MREPITKRLARLPDALKKRPRHYLRWALLHAALVLFFADLLSAFWPAFDLVWKTHAAHLGVAVAAFAATLAEYVTEEENEHKTA